MNATTTESRVKADDAQSGTSERNENPGASMNDGSDDFDAAFSNWLGSKPDGKFVF